MKRLRRAPAETAREFVVLAWAGFFTWLWLSGQMTRYLGPRTYWVVPVGAVALLAVSAAGLLSQRPPRPIRAFVTPGAPDPGTKVSQRHHRDGGRHAVQGHRGDGGRALSFGEAAGLALLLVPIVAVIAVPSPRLGSLAASRKASGEAGLSSFAAAAPAPSGDITFIEIEFASRSSEYAAEAGISEGVRVELVGFVTDPSAPGGGLELTRFYVSCCAADALPHSVLVLPRSERRYPADTWLRVSGDLHQRGGRWVVVGSRVATQREPDDPYLY